ncbi:MAG: tRNA lysidine(34) synthetase TilS [Bacillota bacterium]
MVSPGDLVIVAVSGGPDSMCLLDVLFALSPELGIRLHAAHLNHHMRAQAPKDAAMVRDFAKRLGIECAIGDADVNGLAKERGIGVEEAGREARYSFLRKVRAETGASKIALGHNLNDQAETVLMRLLRGAGTQGLAGIPPVNGDIVRPLLEVPRVQIEEYCRLRNIPTMMDVYNLDPKYTRNALRLEVIPDLEKRFNPSLTKTLAWTASALRWDADLLEEMARQAFLAVSCKQARVTSVERKALGAMPPALSSRVLEMAWRECSGSSGNLPVPRIQELLWSPENVISLPDGVTAVRSEAAIWFYPAPPADLEVSLPIDGSVEVPELGVTFTTRTFEGNGVELMERASQGCKEGSTERSAERSGLEGYPPWLVEPVIRLDYDKLKGPLTVRTRRRGDRFRPLGMEGRVKKLQDFLVQRKVPRFQRDFTPLVTSAGDIVCVAGMRPGEDFRIDHHTIRMLEVEVRPYLRCSRNYATIWRSCPTSGRVYS